ncbi:zinc ribbon domain-containing protein [Amycolatopsis sp., V23-08]|uniref:Zinc ribbon domain-containing protein n=1 Tax=Amycolatopsis heterodermiae TaxID=3110235 RepID=A0ABU5R345_9PSEU|nr:zinc ribbon domain-containing protein [Amycolatopsis sp., V23-08]MEA5360623.1 zinc ribbon domain-containing protein [Amycolatopsis sp., V23-08]
MVAGVGVGRSQSCWRCRSANQPGDGFCQQCGASLVQRDNTTRYLCAAAQISEKYANAAIREFLVEPLRAIPPAPGVDTSAVLREAVASRTRRRIRDGVLLVLALVFLFVNPTALLFWLLAAVVVAMLPGRFRVSGPADLVFAVGVMAVAAFVLGLGLVDDLTSSRSSGSSSSLGYSDLSGADASPVSGLVRVVVLTAVLSLLIFGVLLADQLVVRFLVFQRFRRGAFVVDGRTSPSEWERRLRGLGLEGFRLPLGRVAAAEESVPDHDATADVVVHREFSPFVGAGIPLHQKVITLPLDPSGEHTDPQGISVVELQQHVGAAIDRLRTTSSLGPGRRLENLTQREQVLVPADRLVVDHASVPEVLRDLDHPPAGRLPVEQARALADSAVEWARYYRCFRVESWDRDLTTSCYLHVGTDQRMLYLEWQFLALLPIAPEFRAIDRHRDSAARLLADTFLEMWTLPATLFRRTASVFRRFKPLRQDLNEVVPAKYGADRSLRELAQADRVQSYFQDVDVERYVRIVDATLFRAVGEYLQDHGYSVVEFMKMADPVVNNYDVSGSTFVNSAVGSNSTVNNSKSAKGK